MRFIVPIFYNNEIEEYNKIGGNHELVFLALHKIDERVIVINKKKIDETISLLQEMHREKPFQAVINVYEKFIILAGLIAEALNLPRTIDDPLCVRDKYLMKKKLSGSVDCADAFLLPDIENLYVNIPIAYPCVIKPRYGVNSMCVVKVCDYNALRRVYKRQRKVFRRLIRNNNEGFDFPSDEFIAERYIGGTEHTIDVFVQDSNVVLQMISDKMEMKEPYFVESGDVIPGRNSDETRALIHAAVAGAIRALGIQNGWSHIEVKIHNGKVYVMEAAARMGGGYFSTAIELVYGINMKKSLFDFFVNKTLPSPREGSKSVIAFRELAFGTTFVFKSSINSKYKDNENFMLFNSKLPDGKFFIGPPYNFTNTILEYLIVAETFSEACSFFRMIRFNLHIYKVRVPFFVYAIYTWYRGLKQK
jgi:hypothetical protein